MNPDELKARENKMLMGCLESAKVWLNEAITRVKAEQERIMSEKAEESKPRLVQPKDKYLVIHVRGEAIFGFDGYNHTKSKDHWAKVSECLEAAGFPPEYYELTQLGYEDITVIPRDATNIEAMVDALLHIVHAADCGDDEEWTRNVEVFGYLAEDLFGTGMGSGEVDDEAFPQDNTLVARRGPFRKTPCNW